MKRSVRLAVSVVTGIAAAVVALAYASSVRQEAQAAQQEALARYGGELVAVCVASRDMIDEGNVVVEEWVTSLLPPEAMTSLGDVAGRVATSHIPERAVLSPVYFETQSGSLEIPADKVAVCVASDPQHAVGGSLARGDTVDVYVSDAEIADRLLSARVLDTSALAQGGGDLSWVTLAVDPERVSEVLAAMSAGQITLVAPGRDGGISDDAADEDDSAAADAGDTERASGGDTVGEASSGQPDEDTHREESRDGGSAGSSEDEGASVEEKRGDA